MHHVYGKRGKTAVNKNVLIRDTFTGKKQTYVFFFLLFIGEKNNKNPKQIINFKWISQNFE